MVDMDINIHSLGEMPNDYSIALLEHGKHS